MADYDSSLPIRSEADGADERVHVKLVDGTTPSQRAAVDSSGALSVNEAKVAGTATDVNNGTASAGTQRVTLASDSTGQVTLAAGANTIGSLAANQSVNVAQIAGTATTVNIGNAGAGTQRVVLASDQPAVSVSFGNPAGTLVHNYDTQAALAAAGTDNHDYTVTALKTLTLRRIKAAASAKMRVELFLNAVSFGVWFNSTANPNIDIDLRDLGITVAAGLVVRLARTNLDNQAQDVYSTFYGTEV